MASKKEKLNISNSEKAIFKEKNLKNYHVKENDITEITPMSNFFYVKSNEQFYKNFKRKNKKTYQKYYKGQLEVTFRFTTGRYSQTVKGLSYRYNNIEHNREQAYNDALRMALAIYGKSPDDIEVLSEQYIYYIKR